MGFFKKLKNTAKTFLQRLFICFQLYTSHGLPNHAAACAYGFLLSVAPMLLLVCLFVFIFFESSLDLFAVLIRSIPVLSTLFDDNWLSDELFFFARHGLSSVIFIIGVVWAGRMLAISIQRGLIIAFPTAKYRNPVKTTLITFAIEVSVVVLVLAVILFSRTAMRFYELLEFFPDVRLVGFIASQIGNRVSYIVFLGLISFLIFRFVPVQRPRKYSALKGAGLSIFFYSCTVVVFEVISNRAAYNFIYGTIGNLIILLINVYMFFTFFFIGAQFTYVTDNFEMLAFPVIRRLVAQAPPKESKSRKFETWLFFPVKKTMKNFYREYKKDEIILSQDSAGKSIFFLLEGSAEICLDSQPADTLNKGSFFSEAGHLLSEDSLAKVRAKTDISVLVLPPEIFDTVLEFDTSLDRALIEHLSQRLKNSNEKMLGAFPDNK